MIRIFTVTTAMILTNYAVFASDESTRWPQFRGPNGTGVSSEDKPLPVRFGPSDAVIWKTELPHGHSSPCVWDDRIFLTGFHPTQKRLETICIDRQSGKVLWKRTAPTQMIERVQPVSSPATATPTTDGQRVFVYFGSYGLLCYDWDGNETWKLPLPIPDLRFGTGASPILAGEIVLLNVDQQRESFLLAVNGRTGQTVWRKARPSFQRAWSTPVLLRHEENDLVVVLGGQRLVAYDLKDGTEQWWVGGLPPYPISTPVVAQDRLFLAVSDAYGDSDNVVQPPAFDVFAKEHDKNNDGQIQRNEIPADFVVLNRHTSRGAGDVTLKGWYFASVDRDRNNVLSREEWDKFVVRMRKWPTQFRLAVMAIRLGGRGDVTKTHIVWQESKGVPEVPTPLYLEGRIYTVKNGGIMFCRNAATGKEIYRARLGTTGGYFASPVAGDGKIYAASDRGVVVVVESGDRFRVLSRNNLGEPIFATPAIGGGTLYVRTSRHLYAFGDSK